MNKLLLKFTMIFIFIASNICHSQKLEYYFPNGKKLDEGKTPNYVSNMYFSNEKTYYYKLLNKSNILSVCFKLFSDEPLFIIGNNVTEEQISKATREFKLRDFYRSFDYTHELDKLISSKNTTQNDILTILGKPDNYNISNNNTCLYYRKPNTTFIFNEGILINYQIMK